MEFINPHTFKSIDMEYILSNIMPITPYGIQKKRELKPFLKEDESELVKELDDVETIIELIMRYSKMFHDINIVFKDIKEIRGSLTRIKNGLVLDEVELFELKAFLYNVKELVKFQSIIGEIPSDLIISRNNELEKLFDPENKQDRTFHIYDSYSEELKRIRETKKKLQRELETERKFLISTIEEQVGARPKLSGEVTIMKQDSDKLLKAKLCPYLVEGVSTVIMTTFMLKDSEKLETIKQNLEELNGQEDAEEFKIKAFLTKELAKFEESFTAYINKITRFDFLIAKANFAIKYKCTKPTIHDKLSLEISQGRHLKLEEVLKKKNKEFTPISFILDTGVTIITGANMGGKTVSLKIAGLLATMTQFGIFVPAEKFKTYLFDYIYFSIGDMQSIDSGLSTFGSEILGMIDILKNSNLKGLILIDELARGTNPEEGYAISRAIVRYLKGIESVTMFTTHFDGIAKENGINHLQVKGLKALDFNELNNKLSNDKLGMDIVLDYMDYALEKVETIHIVPRDALNIARLMGLEEKVINWAEDILEEGREDKNE